MSVYCSTSLRKPVCRLAREIVCVLVAKTLENPMMADHQNEKLWLREVRKVRESTIVDVAMAARDICPRPCWKLRRVCPRAASPSAACWWTRSRVRSSHEDTTSGCSRVRRGRNVVTACSTVVGVV